MFFGMRTLHLSRGRFVLIFPLCLFIYYKVQGLYQRSRVTSQILCLVVSQAVCLYAVKEQKQIPLLSAIQELSKTLGFGVISGTPIIFIFKIVNNDRNYLVR